MDGWVNGIDFKESLYEACSPKGIQVKSVTDLLTKYGRIDRVAIRTCIHIRRKICRTFLSKENRTHQRGDTQK